jgi:hydrogenase maturation protein HypF
LGGFVLNDGEGVVIEIEGARADVGAFIHALTTAPPPLARIDAVSREETEALGETAFAIRRSESTGAVTMVSPDIALCDVCAAELRDPANRRYRYPFINCTDCGPRYTIIRALPYDRPNTSMRFFAMCPACEAEYNDPANRRYHAQPISCFDCGPVLRLWRRDGAPRGDFLRGGWKMEPPEGASSEADGGWVEQAAQLILDGKIIAVKGMGGFHLMCDASNEKAVQTLRERKHRPTKPLAVMFPTLEMIKEVVEISEAEERLILSKERPIVIVRKKNHLPSSILHPPSPGVAPGIDRLGVFLPYTPLHVLLLEKLRRPVVATSANLSDEPIITGAEMLRLKLGQVVDAILDYDREIVNACDDSVAMDAGGRTLLLRLARGHAPRSLPLPFETGKKVLAVGAHQKNALGLAVGRHMVLSPHIGDLNSIDAFEYFERTLETFKRFYGMQPDLIVCDKHPGYETTKWALRQELPVLQVQHHYAHALACMAEYGLDEPVLAFCFDGTGYGEDGTLWGGEVLQADPRSYTRIAHLRPFRLLGGEKAVKEPRRVALSLLFECYTLEEVLAMESPAVRSFGAGEIETLHAMWRRGLNAPLSSSAGRLFDAAASLCGLAQTLGYEGESGLLLEAAAVEAAPVTYGYTLEKGVIDWEPMLRDIVAAPSPAAVAAGLHAALAEMIAGIAAQHRQKPVVLSGGVFQNKTLVEAVLRRLAGEGIRFYLQSATPVNDGGIALGQLYHALYKGDA